jgi:hypothetical protein
MPHHTAKAFRDGLLGVWRSAPGQRENASGPKSSVIAKWQNQNALAELAAQWLCGSHYNLPHLKKMVGLPGFEFQRY